MQRLSIIIPVYNEEGTIKQVIEKVKSVKLKDFFKEIIVVEDCSTDKTKEVLKNIKDDSLKMFYHNTNKGKGAAIRTALKNSTGDIILIQDADLEYNPEEYPKLQKPFEDKHVKVVYGSRLEVIRKNLSKMYKLHYFGNLVLTLLTNVLYGTKISDMETCYKVFRREVVENINLKSRRFDFEPEITAKILKKGFKIHEIPIDFHGRKFDEGKKITWVDGVKAAYYLLKYRFSD